jgi:hypothetical protein
VFHRASVWCVVPEKGTKKRMRDLPKSGLTNHSVASFMSRRRSDHHQGSTIGAVWQLYSPFQPAIPESMDSATRFS